MAAIRIQVQPGGAVILPPDLQPRYDSAHGAWLTVVDLGEGTLLLTPQQPRVDELGDQMAEILAADQVTLEDLLEALDSEREDYYRIHYSASSEPLPRQ